MLGHVNSLNCSFLSSKTDLKELFTYLLVGVKWNNAGLYQTSWWVLPKGLPLFFVDLIKLEEAKTNWAHLAFGLRRNGLPANNLFLLWELLIVPLCLDYVFFAFFGFVYFMHLVPHA